MLIIEKENLPEGIAYIENYYYDRNGNDIEKIEDAEIFRSNSYDKNNNRVSESFGFTNKYLRELAKDNPELLEELEEESDSLSM